jgi:hypothetical protein
MSRTAYQTALSKPFDGRSISARRHCKLARQHFLGSNDRSAVISQMLQDDIFGLAWAASARLRLGRR